MATSLNSHLLICSELIIFISYCLQNALYKLRACHVKNSWESGVLEGEELGRGVGLVDAQGSTRYNGVLEGILRPKGELFSGYRYEDKKIAFRKSNV